MSPKGNSKCDLYGKLSYLGSDLLYIYVYLKMFKTVIKCMDSDDIVEIL